MTRVEHWSDVALCTQMSGELFFPFPSHKTAEVRFAVCSQCPVRAQCLEEGVTMEYQPSGVWGGLPEREVRKLWRARRREDQHRHQVAS